jgi:acetyltransferase-like isoleucine patch superfamily enzyme
MAQEKILIGSDVIIAWDTYITDSDWHQIGDTQKSQETRIGNHVWIANGVKILRGSRIGDNSIVACGAVIAGGDFIEKSLIGGVPAKVIRLSIENWKR